MSRSPRFPSSASPGTPPPSRRLSFPWLVLVVGVSLSGLTAGWSWREHRADARAALERRGQDMAIAVQRTIEGREQVLRGMRVLLDHSEELLEQEFSDAARDYRERFPDIAALEWVPRVAAADRAAFEAELSLRTDVASIMEMTSFEDLTLRPARARAEYFPVTFIEPLAPNRPALGFDISSAASWPSRLWSMRNGEPGGSGITPLYREADLGPSLGWIMHLPVYVDPSNRASGVDRTDRLLGFLLGVFRLEDLLAVTRESQVASQLDLWLFESEGSAGPQLHLPVNGESIVDAARIPPFQRDDRWAVLQIVRAGDRTWELGLAATRDWRAQSYSAVPFLLLVLGLAVTGLVVSLISAVSRRHEAVRREVEMRTAQLRASREELAGVLENSPNMIFLKDLEGRYLSVNPRFCQVLGQKREDVLGRTDEELNFPPEEVAAYREIDERVIREGRAFTCENTSVAGPVTVSSLVHKFPLFDEHGAIRGVCGIATDITDLKRLETEQRAVERKMLEAQRLESLGVLAGGVAHDFNNLLTGVLGNTSLALADVEPGSPLEELLKDVRSAGLRAAELCSQLLDYTGKNRREAQAADLNRLIEELLPLLRHTVSKNTRLRLDQAANLPAIRVDPSQLRQVIMNLVINGSEALGERAGDVVIATSTSSQDLVWEHEALIRAEVLTPPFVLMRVTDNGQGMDEATRQRVLDPFFTTKFTGRGLGLAAVGGIVRAHGGAMRLLSQPGVGTTFELALPATADIAMETTSAAPAADWTGTGRVLVIDDEETLRRVASRALEHLGFEVDQAADGQTGWEMVVAQPQRYAAVLLDMTMPGWGGRQVWGLLHELRPELPVILMSGYSSMLEVGNWTGERPAGVLAKPFTLEQLRQVFRTVLD